MLYLTGPRHVELKYYFNFILKSLKPLGKIKKSSKDTILSQNNIRFRTTEFVAESLLLSERAENAISSETRNLKSIPDFPKKIELRASLKAY